MTPAPCAKSVRLLRVFLVLRFSSARPREVTQVWPAFAVPPFHDSIFWGASRSPPRSQMSRPPFEARYARRPSAPERSLTTPPRSASPLSLRLRWEPCGCEYLEATRQPVARAERSAFVLDNFESRSVPFRALDEVSCEHR